jgi:hypothetical protein
MSRNSTLAVNDGSTHVAFGFLIGFASFDFGLTTVSSLFLIWPDTVRDQPLYVVENEFGTSLAADRRVARREELERHRAERTAAGRELRLQ